MKFYNTLTRKLEPFKPRNDKRVSLYTCGLTVYSHPHIGNWTAYIYWDVLVRSLRQAGYQVTRVQNITDVGHLSSDEDSGEDKMEKGAKREGLTAWDIAEKYIAVADHEAYELLGLLRPDYMPRATDYIQQQIDFVKMLEDKGLTYKIEGDGIYFDTSKLDDYGKLARLDIDGLKRGARVQDSGKKNVTDFAVWKFSPKNQKRDMEWESPWGIGFPGWHLECSVMARELLGDQIDIHTGGIDHIPIHHTNEIAQTEAVTGKPFAGYWLHNNHIKIEGGKMAKSTGNIFTLQDLQDKGYSIEAFKLMVLSSHYRTEGNFTWEILDAAQNRLKSLQAMAVHRFQAESVNGLNKDNFKAYQKEVTEALANDLNTPQALATIAELENQIDTSGVKDIPAFTDFLQLLDELFGFNLLKIDDISQDQKNIINERETARKNKDWAQSDKLRAELTDQGIGLRDTAYGQVWYWL